MKVFTLASTESEASDPNTFVGQARLTRMVDAATAPSTHVYRVTFEAGARTNWHTHSGPQLLQVIDGVCRFQVDGDTIREAVTGDVIAFEPDERHWHGAGPGGGMTHIAVNIAAATTWLEPVTETEYTAVTP